MKFETTTAMLPATPLQNPAKTLSSLFNLSTSLPLLKQLHAHLVSNGFHQSVIFGSQLSNAYIQLGSFETAFKAFDQIPHKNPRSWNTILSGYSDNKKFSDVIRLYKQMRGKNFPVDSFSMVFAVKACVGLSLIEMGRCVHSEGVKSGLDLDCYVAPAIMNMYDKCGGSLEDTRKVFEKIPERHSSHYGVMMKGYLKCSKENEVFELFRQMRESGFELDSFAMDVLIQACGSVCAGKFGNALHGYCVKRSFLGSSICLHTSMVDMYMKCGLWDFAKRLFGEMEEKDVVLWSTMVAGFAKNGKAADAISFFRSMMKESVTPNGITLASVLLACSQLGALQQGKSVHGYEIRKGIKFDVVNYTTLIDMYAKCGSIKGATIVFNQMPGKNVFSWSAMINGFGIHGLYSEAIAMFNQMRYEKQVPNAVTFVSVLSACSHSGRVVEGFNYLESMSRDYGITPLKEHYACMVDLLGRAGKMEEAESFIEKMPLEPGASVWGALLSACRIHKRVELAEKVAEKLLALEPDQPDTYILLSNIYAAAGMWDRAKKIRAKMTGRGLRKELGCSSIEVKKKVYVFSAKDRVKYRNTRLEDIWNDICEQMKALGYVPDKSFILHDVDDEVKDDMLCGHSEKLAIAFGLLETGPDVPIRITKNLRVCGDCHTASKFVSLVTKREIIMRDIKRFHHFKDGTCSCQDYW